MILHVAEADMVGVVDDGAGRRDYCVASIHVPVRADPADERRRMTARPKFCETSLRNDGRLLKPVWTRLDS